MGSILTRIRDLEDEYSELCKKLKVAPKNGLGEDWFSHLHQLRAMDKHRKK
jgi:hypothetical protein